MRQVLDSQQRFDGNDWRFIKVVAALSERMALDLTAVV
jgi:hypothetical protein